MNDFVSPAPAVRRPTPIHLWIVGVLALLWNSIGAFDYTATQLKLDWYMSNFTPEQLDYFYGFPAWAVACWAFGVWGAIAGSVGLLLRKRWAVWMFGLSLLGMLGTTIYNFVLTDGMELMGAGPGEMIFMVLIWIVAIALFVYARRQAANGVLT